MITRFLSLLKINRLKTKHVEVTDHLSLENGHSKEKYHNVEGHGRHIMWFFKILKSK